MNLPKEFSGHKKKQVLAVGHFTDPTGAPVSLVQVRLHTGRRGWKAVPDVPGSRFWMRLYENCSCCRRHQIRAHLRYEGHPLIGDWSVKDSLLWYLWQILEVRWSHIWRWCRNVVWQSFLALLPPWPGPKDQWHWCPCKTQEMWRIEMMTREWHLPKSSHLRSHIRLHLARNIDILLLCFVDFYFVCHAVFGKVLPWPFHRYRLVKCSCHCRPTCAWYCQMPSTWSMQHVLCM